MAVANRQAHWLIMRARAQQADMPLALTQQLQGLTEAIDRDTKQEFGHDRQAQ